MSQKQSNQQMVAQAVSTIEFDTESPSTTLHPSENNRNSTNSHSSNTSTIDEPLRNVRSYNTFKSHLNWYYAFQSTPMQKLYQEFHTINRSTGTFYFVVGLFFVGILLPIQISETINDLLAYSTTKSNPKYPYRVLTTWILLLDQFIGVLTSWFLASYHMKFFIPSFYNKYLAPIHEGTLKYLSYVFKFTSMNDLIIQCTYIELGVITVYFWFVMIQTCLGLNCVTPTSAISDAFSGGECFSGPALFNSVLAHGFLVLVLPLLIAVNMPELSAKFIWANFWLSCMVVVLVAAFSNQIICLTSLFLWGGICFFSIVDAVIRNITLFFVHMDLNDTLLEVRRMEEETRANEMRSMIANVAHDLKTPLASFCTGMEYIDDILRSVNAIFEINNVSSVCKEGLENIATCLRGMKNTNAFMLMTINRCIDYTKATKGISLIPHYETISLQESIQLPMDCVSNLQDRIAIQLQFLSSDICPFLITDKQWLQENLLCLLSNAVKYSSNGTVKISIQMSQAQDLPSRNQNHTPVSSKGVIATALPNYKPTDLFVLCSIEDEGIGIPTEAQSQLFQPFRQAQRLTGGTGLGLFSLAMRMKALNGYYGIQNRTDHQRGSIFWFAFPYRPDLATQQLKEMQDSKSEDSGKMERKTQLLGLHRNSSSTSSIEGVGTKTMKVLVVDDSPAIIKMTSMMLKRKGFDITTAENGQVALDQVIEQRKENSSRFDVILMDLQMPVMDGLEATRRIREFEINSKWLHGHLIIGMSANSDHETVEEAMKAGLNHFLAKPFNITSFQDLIMMKTKEFLMNNNEDD